MGLFDSDIVVVEAVSAKLSKEKSKPLRDAVVIAAALDRNIASHIQAVMVSGYHIKIRRYLKYGNEKYSLGPGEVSFRLRYFKFGVPPEDIPIEMEMYPTVLIRRDGVFINEDKESEEYITGRRLARRAKLNLNDLTDLIAEGNEGSGIPGEPPPPNPDLDKINDAFFTFSFDIYSRLEETAEYMFGFWEYMFSLPQQTLEEFEEALLGLGDEAKGPPSNSLLFTHGDFFVDISWDYMLAVDGSGTLVDKDGKELEFQSNITFLEPTTHFFDGGGGGGPGALDTPGTLGDANYTVQRTYFQIKKQTGPGVIREYQVHGMYHNTTVTPFGENFEVKTKITLDEEQWNLDYEDELHGRSGFFIPLSVEHFRAISVTKQQIVAHDSLQLVLYAADKIHLEWYETKLFKGFVTALGIIITAFTFDFSGTITAIVWEIVKALAVAYVLAYVAELIAGEFGTAGLLFATAVAVYAGTKYGYFNTNQLATADQLMKMTKIFNIVVEADLSVKSDQLEDEIESWTKSVEERQEELDAANDFLDSGDGFYDPLWVTMSSDQYFQTESPTQFFERTIHMQNPGVLSMDQIHNFHSNALELPMGTVENNILFS